MSSNENSSSSSDSSNFKELDEWEERVAQQNHQLDRIIEDLFISNPNMIAEGSRARRKYRDRKCEIGEERLMDDYFVDNPTYDANIFRHRFRMRKSVFLRIVEQVTAGDGYFLQRPDATGRLGLSPLQKCTGAMRVLAYGTSTDAVDEYLRMSSAVTREALIKFVQGVISCFGEKYLRRPDNEDMERLKYVGEQRGFPGMIGSIDCMHWEWKNCPSAWAGQYAGRSGKPTIILEAVASYDLWIWHAFFGTPGTCNDINVLHRSPVFNDILEGRAPKIEYVVNDRLYDRAYYLTDGIYPQWAAFVKSINPVTRKHKLFAEHQESCRKDVELAFGVLQARFAFLRRPCLVWDRHLMEKIMMACIIMHNMIVEDERHTYLHYYDPTEFFMDKPTNKRKKKKKGKAKRNMVQEEVEDEDEDDEDEPFTYSTERIANLSTYMTIAIEQLMSL